MSPISLTISGLHSFRTERTIEFEPLMRERLFGIFGPTGSGKSTILDAITLALFGKIERTTGNRVESAITSGLNDCRVAFTFEIDLEGERQRFTAERSYHVRPSGMRSKVRLIHHDPDHVDDPDCGKVIAEKGGEMEEQIDRILAISADDFARAVVLPQGAFAEFLRMSRGDRATMLKRLFGLEELGDRIDTNLRSLLTALSSERREREGKLSELVQFDDDVLAERKKDVELAEQEAAAWSERLASAEQASADAETLYRKVIELNRLRAGAEERTEQRQRIESLRTELRRAVDAAEVEGVVAAARDAAERESNAREKLEGARLEQKKAEELIAPLVPRKSRADDNRADGGAIPRLTAEISLLNRITELDRQILQLVRAIADRTGELNGRRDDLERIRRTASTSEAEEERLVREEKESCERLATIAEEQKELERKKGTIGELLVAAEALARSAEKVAAQRQILRTAVDEGERLRGELGEETVRVERAREEVDRVGRRLEQIRRDSWVSARGRMTTSV